MLRQIRAHRVQGSVCGGLRGKFHPPSDDAAHVPPVKRCGAGIPLLSRGNEDIVTHVCDILIQFLNYFFYGVCLDLNCLSAPQPRVVGFFQFNSSPQPPGYTTFLASALQALKRGNEITSSVRFVASCYSAPGAALQISAAWSASGWSPTDGWQRPSR